MNIDPVHWFLSPAKDTRSSLSLEDAATEFQVQGLELDWTIVTWDADFGRGQNTGSCTNRSVRYKYGMDTPQTMTDILAATLQALESLAHQKLADGDFDEVTRVASAASTIRSQMLRDPNARVDTPSTEASGEATSVASATSGETRHKKSAAWRRPRGYPSFYKDDDRLVKVGWSKKNRCAYEHRAGKDAAYAVLDAIRHRLSNRRTFKVEDLSASTSGPKNAEVPQYVQYLVVAWLESCNILEKNGRDGYSKNASGLASRTNADLWQDIPARANNS